jgi:hypothetical protein
VFSATVATVAALAAFAGCGSETGSGADPGPQPRIDRARGVIVMPLNRYSLRDHERKTIDYAEDLVLGSCMHRHGGSFPVVDRRGEPPEPSRLYGIWTPRVARTYGYKAPPGSSGEQTLENFNAHLDHAPPREVQAYSRCIKAQGLGRLVVPSPLKGDVAFFRIYGQTMRSRPALRVLADWHRCLKEHGIEPPSLRGSRQWIPPHAAGDVRKIALTDVRCKQRVDLVQRLAALESTREGRWIAAHRSILRAQRREIEQVLARAKRVIRQAGSRSGA